MIEYDLIELNMNMMIYKKRKGYTMNHYYFQFNNVTLL